METCQICNKLFEKKKGLYNHISYTHKVSVLEYFVNYSNFKIPKCLYCENNAKL